MGAIKKLTTLGVKIEYKQNKNTTQYVLDTTIHKQTNKQTTNTFFICQLRRPLLGRTII